MLNFSTSEVSGILIIAFEPTEDNNYDWQTTQRDYLYKLIESREVPLLPNSVMKRPPMRGHCPPMTAKSANDRQDRQRRASRVSPTPWRSWRLSSAKDCLPVTCENCLSANGLADLDLFQNVCVW